MKFKDIIVHHPKKGKTTINRLSKEEIFDMLAMDIRRSEAEKKYLIKIIHITKRQRDYFRDNIRRRKGQD